MARDGEGNDTYVMGRTEAETQRLMLLAKALNLPLQRWLEDAGVSPGMRVLDVGTGAGDVALVAGAMVGPQGSVVGVDMNAALLESARERASAAGLGNVSFVQGDLRENLALAND